MDRIEMLLSQAKDDVDFHELNTVQTIYDLEYKNYFDGEFLCSEIELLTSFSIITLSYMIFETSMVDFAKIAEQHYELQLKYNEIQGGKIGKIKIYFSKLTNINISEFKSWPHLMNLEKLRNLIVHSNGKISNDQNMLKIINNFKRTYPSGFCTGFPQYRNENQIIIKISLCSFFINEIKSFFNELIEKLGMNSKGQFGEEVHQRILEEKTNARIEFKQSVMKARAIYNKRMKYI
jgi:hypothetical protein